MEMTKQEGSALIAAKLKEVDRILRECTEIADTLDISFYFSSVGYGAGGSYNGKDGEWYASSDNC